MEGKCPIHWAFAAEFQQKNEKPRVKTPCDPERTLLSGRRTQCWRVLIFYSINFGIVQAPSGNVLLGGEWAAFILCDAQYKRCGIVPRGTQLLCGIQYQVRGSRGAGCWPHGHTARAYCTGILWGGVAGWGWGHSKLPNHSFGEVHECVDGTLVSKQHRELRDS